MKIQFDYRSMLTISNSLIHRGMTRQLSLRQIRLNTGVRVGAWYSTVRNLTVEAQLSVYHTEALSRS